MSEPGNDASLTNRGPALVGTFGLNLRYLVTNTRHENLGFVA